MLTPANWLSENRAEALKKALQSFGRTAEQLENDMKTIKEWLKTQPHLPEIPTDNHIINALLMNKFSIENTKQRLDMYYTIRTLLPDIYENRGAEFMVKMADIIYFFPLPKRTPEGNRINMVKMIDSNPDHLEMYSWMGYCYNTLELKVHEDVLTAEIVVNDLQNVKLGHIPKVTPIHLKKIVMILEKVYNNRLREFHFVNCPPFAYNMLSLLKSFVKPKLAARIFLHEDTSHIGKIIPLEILPKDYGGQELPLQELNEIWKKKLADYGDRFDQLAKMKTNEKLRPTPLVNDDILGFHGNFRKLDMD